MIESSNLKENLEIILNKSINDAVESDLQNIDVLGYEKKSEKSLNDLLLFPNLITLNLRNSRITYEDIKILSKLKNLKNINFSNCIIAPYIDLGMLKKLESLGFDRCFISNYGIFQRICSIKSLSISCPEINEQVDALLISYLINLESLSLKACMICNSIMLSRFKKLKNLYLMLSDIDNLDFVYQLNNLDELYLPEKYINNINIDMIKVNIKTNEYDLVMDDENYSKGIV